MMFLGENIVPENYNTVFVAQTFNPRHAYQTRAGTGGEKLLFRLQSQRRASSIAGGFSPIRKNTGMENRAGVLDIGQVDVPMDPQLRVLNWKTVEGARARRLPARDPILRSRRKTVGQGRHRFGGLPPPTKNGSPSREKPIYTELGKTSFLSGSVNVGRCVG